MVDYVVFTSLARNLVAGDTNSSTDIFVHDRNTGMTTRVSLNTDDTQGNRDSRHPSISADGRYVVFQSTATDLVSGDTNASPDIFIHDRNTSITTRVSLHTDGTEGNGSSYNSSVSADGRFIAFASFASNLVTGDTNGKSDIFIHDRNSGVTRRVNINAAGIQGNNDSSQASFLTSTQFLSADGRYLAFPSSASNLVVGDTNSTTDIFVTPNPLPRTRNDFDGDGKADILWRHATSDLNYLYLMNGISVASHGPINTVADFDWQIEGTNDFDGDGKTDILWRHATSGLNYLYLMDGVSISSHGLINTVADLDWQVKGIADFNGDGKADILWRHATTGSNYLYLMNGTSIASHGEINILNDLDWQVKGIADFNGDDKADILWRHATTGSNYLYLMNGTSIAFHGEINILNDLDWQVKGVADFNSDGKADILWRHAASGQNWIYLMDGVSINVNGGVNIVSDLDWQIKGVADFNDDGKADILWRHVTSGLNYLYLMDGISITSHGRINYVPDLDWQIQ